MTLKTVIFLVTLTTSLSSFGQIKLSDLKIDTTITGFHYTADFQGTHIFTKNGPSDLNSINPTAFSFTIAPNMTAKDAAEQLQILYNMSKQNGYKITDIIKKDTLINGYNSYYISYTESEENSAYKNLVFNAFIIKNNTLILFVSGDLDNGQYIDKIKKTFYSIKL